MPGRTFAHSLDTPHLGGFDSGPNESIALRLPLLSVMYSGLPVVYSGLPVDSDDGDIQHTFHLVSGEGGGKTIGIRKRLTGCVFSPVQGMFLAASFERKTQLICLLLFHH